MGQTFWAIWDREDHRMWERTRTLVPGARGEVWSEGGEEGRIDYAADEGSLVRIEAHDVNGQELRAFLRMGGGRWVESVCPAGDDAYVWTRKRGDVTVRCDVRLGERRWRLDARGIEDESAGYHPRHTIWSWSAGVGRATDGRSIGWNLVSGINDPPERSERAVWVDGDPFEPGPVRFEGLDSIDFGEGSRLEFTPEAERYKRENRLLIRYEYRQPFGGFAGTLAGGIELDRGLGVMEHHDARW